MTELPKTDAWRKAWAADAVLGTGAGPWAVCWVLVADPGWAKRLTALTADFPPRLRTL